MSTVGQHNPDWLQKSNAGVNFGQSDFRLESFANTKKFKNTFLTNAKIVAFETTGLTIWSKK